MRERCLFEIQSMASGVTHEQVCRHVSISQFNVSTYRNDVKDLTAIKMFMDFLSPFFFQLFLEFDGLIIQCGDGMFSASHPISFPVFVHMCSTPLQWMDFIVVQSLICNPI